MHKQVTLVRDKCDKTKVANKPSLEQIRINQLFLFIHHLYLFTYVYNEGENLCSVYFPEDLHI